jgi:hypothetical protein
MLRYQIQGAVPLNLPIDVCYLTHGSRANQAFLTVRTKGRRPSDDFP